MTPDNDKNTSEHQETPRLQARKLLKKLSPAQFKDVLLLYEVQEEYLSIHAPQMTQIAELIKYACGKEGEQLTELVNVIRQVSPNNTKSGFIPRFLPYRVNRDKQEQTLAEAIQTHDEHPDKKPRPFLCLIHGNADECSDMFVECLLEQNALRKIAPYQTQKGIKRYTFSCGNFNYINELQKNLLTNLGKALCNNLLASRAEIVEAIAQHEQKVVMLYTNLCSEDWQHDMNILQGFLEFWTDLPALPSNHLLLVCLSFNYQKSYEITFLKRLLGKQSTNQEIRKVFQNLESKFNDNDFPVSGVVLPELDSMTHRIVQDWARIYASQFCDIDVLYQEIKTIFTFDGQKIAMEPLATQLKQILNNCTV